MNEDQAIDRVATRLVERFPELTPETVRLVVRAIHRRFDGRVRDFVPILVEREASGRLKAAIAALAPQALPSPFTRREEPHVAVADIP